MSQNGAFRAVRRSSSAPGKTATVNQRYANENTWRVGRYGCPLQAQIKLDFASLQRLLRRPGRAAAVSEVALSGTFRRIIISLPR